MPPHYDSDSEEGTDKEQRRCRECQSYNFVVDWQQGDIICTSCGVVCDSHIIDESYEGRNFNNDEDRARKAFANSDARCGMVPNDESRYAGGMQPTSLSRRPFGGSYKMNVSDDFSSSGNQESSGDGIYSGYEMNKRLKRTHIRVEKMLQVQHTNQVREALLARKILDRKKMELSAKSVEITSTANSADPTDSRNNDNTMESERIQQEMKELEDKVSSISSHHYNKKSSLFKNKWSLERALLLHGSPMEASSVLVSIYNRKTITDRDGAAFSDSTLEQERTEIYKQMDKSDKVASLDLYRAYSIILSALSSMKLDEILLKECVNWMVEFVSLKNGFHIKGINSQTNLDKEETKELNKIKQMSALGAATVFVMAKKLGVGRGLQDICSHFYEIDLNNHPHPHFHSCFFSLSSSTKSSSLSETSSPSYKLNTSFVLKPKHVSKATSELKEAFPDVFRSIIADTTMNAANLVHGISERLDLPPMASGSIRAICIYCGEQQMKNGAFSGILPNVICAGVTYLVCHAGSIMQRLAKQAVESAENTKTSKPIKKEDEEKDIVKLEGCDRSVFITGISKKKKGTKRSREQTKIYQATKLDFDIENADDPSDLFQLYPETESSESSGSDNSTKIAKTFDALTSDSTYQHDEKVSSPQDNFDQELYTLRGWFSWSNQKPWGRTLVDIEKSFNNNEQKSKGNDGYLLSHKKFHNFYKNFLFEQRHFLLKDIVQKHLEEYSSSSIDGSCCHFVNIEVVAPLMSQNV